MGDQRDNGKVRLHVNMPFPLWEKLRVTAQLSSSPGNSSALAQVAIDAFAAVSRTLGADGFAAVGRRRAAGERTLSVVLLVDASTAATARDESRRLGTSASSWVETAVAAMLSEVNPMLYEALRDDFAKTMRKWGHGFGADMEIERLCSGEPTVRKRDVRRKDAPRA